MKMSCEVIRDLLPLYHDQVCTQASRELVEEHLDECEACRAALARLAEDIPGAGRSADMPDYMKTLTGKPGDTQPADDLETELLGSTAREIEEDGHKLPDAPERKPRAPKAPKAPRTPKERHVPEAEEELPGYMKTLVGVPGDNPPKENLEGELLGSTVREQKEKKHK